MVDRERMTQPLDFQVEEVLQTTQLLTSANNMIEDKGRLMGYARKKLLVFYYGQ